MDPAINRKKGKLNLSFEFDQFWTLHYCINSKLTFIYIEGFVIHFVDNDHAFK